MPAPNWRPGGCWAKADRVQVPRRTALGLLAGGLSSAVRGIDTAPLALTAGALSQGGWARGRAAPGASLLLDGAPVSTDPRGDFLIAFDRDAPASARLELREGARLAASQDLIIAPRSWQIERIDAPLRPRSMPSEDYQRLRAAELARIGAARALITPAQGWRQTMIRPAPGRISGRFGAQRIYQGQPGAYHTGLDLAAAAGTPILAPADGVVILAASSAPFTLEGKLLLIDHGMGLSSAFLHCSAHAVREGESVARGQPIASVGMTGRATGPHLHWGLRWRQARLDPLLFLEAQP